MFSLSQFFYILSVFISKLSRRECSVIKPYTFTDVRSTETFLLSHINMYSVFLCFFIFFNVRLKSSPLFILKNKMLLTPDAPLHRLPSLLKCVRRAKHAFDLQPKEGGGDLVLGLVICYNPYAQRSTQTFRTGDRGTDETISVCAL